MLTEQAEQEVRAGSGEAAGGITGYWGSCCEWLGRTLKGIETSMERMQRDGNSEVDFRNWPLVRVQARQLENGVNAIDLTFAANHHERLFQITGVTAVRVEFDAAKFPTAVEFVSKEERVVLQFVGGAQAKPMYSGNSWGE